MILSSFLAALSQLGDGRFLRVLALGVALSAGLLAAVYLVFVQLIGWFMPETVTLPWIGQVGWIDDALGWGSLILMLGLSVFLMVPVAVLFAGLFLDGVAQAVEDRHYPGLPPPRDRGVVEDFLASARFLGVVMAVNALALVGYLVAGPLAPVLFWAVNGYLLGREYFQTVALRRVSPPEAEALRRANGGTVWLAGALMAAPLALPLVNLFVPVIGVATFTHIFHGIAGRQSLGPSRPNQSRS